MYTFLCLVKQLTICNSEHRISKLHTSPNLCFSGKKHSQRCAAKCAGKCNIWHWNSFFFFASLQPYGHMQFIWLQNHIAGMLNHLYLHVSISTLKFLFVDCWESHQTPEDLKILYFLFCVCIVITINAFCPCWLQQYMQKLKVHNK